MLLAVVTSITAAAEQIALIMLSWSVKHTLLNPKTVTSCDTT